LIAGAILSVTVPETTIRSACRGPWANGITPSRMKSCRPMLVAMNSMAQQARPKLNTHREYRRPQFSTNLIGSPSTPGSPIRPSSRPPQHALAPGVEQPEREHADEDRHLHHDHHDEAGVGEDHRPREQEHRLHGEEHIQVRVDVVPDLRLRPVAADRIQTALVRRRLLGTRTA